MGKEFPEIDERIQRWIDRQQMFFVSTAPLAGDGRLNCSPKGLDSLRVLGPRKIAYADAGGSGIETVAHLKENGRIVIMLCAFEGPPKIYRFYGQGRAVEPHNDEFDTLVPLFPELPAIRNFIVVDVDHPTLCGRAGDALLDSWVFAGSGDRVRDVYVGGRRVVADGIHMHEREVDARFRQALAELAD